MRIAEIASGHGLNGAAVHASRLTRALAARGHDVVLICRHDSWIQRQLSDGAADVVTSDLHRWPPDELRRIARLLDRRGIDLVHTHMSRAHLFGVLLKAHSDARIIATAHNRVVQPHWMFNDHVIAVSEAVGRFQRRWNRVPANRLTVVHNFVDVSAFEHVPAEARTRIRAELRVGGDTFLVGVVGSVFAEKGVHHVLEALPAIYQRAPGVTLAIVGQGAPVYVRKLRAMIARLGLGSRVVWTGMVDRIPELLAALDLLVVPSSEDAFSLVSVEAMAAGLPVVASTVGGIPECVVDGETGVLVPPASPRALARAIVDLAGDRERRNRMGAAGRERARRFFSLDRQVAAIEGVFSSVVHGVEPGTPHPESIDELPAFSRQLATCRTVIVSCREVVDLLPVSHAPERIAAYRDDMQRGQSFPPISVVRWCGRFLLADGHKRFAAYRSLGHDRIVVEVWSCGRWLRDQWRQARANANKNAQILRHCVSNPSRAFRLFASTVLHWRRVATSLVLLSRSRGDRRSG